MFLKRVGKDITPGKAGAHGVHLLCEGFYNPGRLRFLEFLHYLVTVLDSLCTPQGMPEERLEVIFFLALDRGSDYLVEV